MTSRRPNTTHFKHRSFSLQRKSTFTTTKENLLSPAKSLTSKSSDIFKSLDKSCKFDPMTASVPVEIYFNSQFKKTYTTKVIDSFFNESSFTLKTPDSRISNLFIKNQTKSIRNRILKKNLLKSNDLDNIESNEFIRSPKKKSIPVQFSSEKSLQKIVQNIQVPFIQSNKSQIYGKSNQSIQSISLNQSRIYRPFSEQKNKTKNLFSSIKKLTDSDNFSLSFHEENISPQKLHRIVRKKKQSHKYYEDFYVFQNQVLQYTLRNYLFDNNPMWIRQDKIQKLGLKTLWKHSKFPHTLQFPISKSLKDCLSQQFCYGSSEPDLYVEIYPKPYFHQLFLNKNQEIIDIILSMTKFILNNKGKILTCAFQTKNLYKVNQKQFFLKDLGLSAILEQIKIRDKMISYLFPPLFKEQPPGRQWLARPQYLPPEVLQSIKHSDFSWIKQSPQDVMAAEVWCLGCMLLQILTLIPLNSDIRYRVKPNPQVLRRGFLSINFSQKLIDFEALGKKQAGLQTNFRKSIKSELFNIPVLKKVLQIVQKMVIYEPKDRIKPQEIIRELKY